jgi:hypothetical protein
VLSQNISLTYVIIQKKLYLAQNFIKNTNMKKKKIIVSMSLLIAWAALLPAANITREQANAIVQDYAQTLSGLLYFNAGDPSEEGITITTFNEETVRAKYACWAYCLNESEPAQRRYLFVKEDGSSLLEVIASNDLSELDDSWVATDTPTGLAAGEGKSMKLLYPNPVGDLLTIPCNGDQARVEIYDLKGTRLFSGLLSGKDACQLNVSFLNAGVYMVNVSGETYKMIKN